MWNTIDQARDLWADASRLSDETLTLYLESAHQSCLAYAPAHTAAEVPASWLLAEVFQARNIYNAAKVSPSGDLDGGAFGLSTHPLDWQIKQLLRPRRGKPVVR